MAFSTSTIKPASQQTPVNKTDNATIAASLLSMLLLGAYAARQGKKSLRKMKRRLMWDALKMKLKSVFSKQQDVSDRTLLLIIAAVVLLAIFLISWQAGLITLLVLLLLYLLGVIKV